MTTVGQALISLLEAYGVDTVFGIPGVHTIELYRGLHGSGIRHVTPRHEQGAGFMADGYARASGAPGVAFTITGPGLTNIATAMGQAYADSIPMLVVSSVNARRSLGLGSGRLHELPDQSAVARGVSAFSHTLLDPRSLPQIVAHAFAQFGAARPRPVHIEIPTDVLDLPAEDLDLGARPLPAPPGPDADAVAAAAALLSKSARTIILAGGGAVGAADELRRIAERLSAPVFLTANARGLLPPGHPLLVDGLQSSEAGHALIAAADAAIAVGTELGETDYDFSGQGLPKLPRALLRVDLDPLQIAGGPPVAIGMVSDARAALRALLDALGDGPRPAPEAAQELVAKTNAAARQNLDAAQIGMAKTLDGIRDALGDPIIVGDSTQPIYQGSVTYRASGPRGWFNSSTGYGTLGYALPAAIGAKIAAPDRPVVAFSGDGGIQFTLPELATAAQERVGIIAVVWNNHGYREIRDVMVARDVVPVGVDVQPPDFLKVAAANGITAQRAASIAELGEILSRHGGKRPPLLVEIGPDIAV